MGECPSADGEFISRRELRHGVRKLPIRVRRMLSKPFAVPILRSRGGRRIPRETTRTQGTISNLRKHSVLSWIFPIVLFVLAAFVSSLAQKERGHYSGGGADYDGAKTDLLWEIGRRPSLAFGFRNFLADLAWLDAVQVMGDLRMTRNAYDRLTVLVETVTNLDPKFAVPYLVGGLVLGDSPDHAQKALGFLERGIRHHPSDWRFPFYIGYIRYFTLGDPAEGGRALREASGLRDSPPYLPFLASRMLAEGRKPETALEFLAAMIRQETDPSRKGILERRIKEVVVERDIQALEAAVQAYRGKTETFPERFSDLVEAGLIRGVPREPNGGRYLLSSDGRVRSSTMTQRLKVFRLK